MASSGEQILSFQEFSKCIPREVGSPSSPLPMIDIRRLLSADEAEDELQKLHITCKEWGFFQVVNHGINSNVVEQMNSQVVEFFSLSFEEKMKYQRNKNEGEGYWRNETKIDRGEEFSMTLNPIYHRRREIPFPLRGTLESYCLELQKLAKMLMLQMAKALKMDRKEMEEYMLVDGTQFVRMSYYPPFPEPDQVIGFKAHTDGSGLSILLQVNGVDGLQIKKDGAWIPVNFLPDAFVVNIGDILEIMSNGVYESVEHRVTTNSTKERISMATFFSPNVHARVGPAPSLISPQNQPLFTTISMQQYLADFFARTLKTKTNLEHMRIKSKEDED